MLKKNYIIIDSGIRVRGCGATLEEAEKDARFKLLQSQLERKNHPCIIQDREGNTLYANYKARLHGFKSISGSFRYLIKNLDVFVIEHLG